VDFFARGNVSHYSTVTPLNAVLFFGYRGYILLKFMMLCLALLFCILQGEEHYFTPRVVFTFFSHKRIPFFI